MRLEQNLFFRVMLKEIYVCMAFVFGSLPAFSQVGGYSSFDFLTVPVNARVAGVGGVNVSSSDKDVNMILQNPAVLNSSMNKMLSLNYLPYYGGIQASSLAYAHQIKSATWGFGMQYLNYGTINSTNASGADQGTFSSNDFMVMASRSHKINYYTLGASLKFAGSQIAGYNAYALMADVGGTFKHPTKDFTVGLVFKNVGYAFKQYATGTSDALPFDVQAGTSFKPQHFPIRLSITLDHLQKLNVVYNDTTVKQYDINGNPITTKTTLSDEIARHFIIGGEVIVSKNFNLRFGYNYERRQELRLTSVSGGAGFSFGFMFRIKTFEIAYTKAYYHVVGGTNFFTVAMDMSGFVKKNKNISSE